MSKVENILITGSTGLVGEVLFEELKCNTFYNTYGISRSSENEINSIKLDLSQDWSTEILPKKIDIIIHLVQSEKFRDFPDSAKEVFDVNTNSTLKLLDYARKVGVKKFIYASSGGVYGNSDYGFSEDSSITIRNDIGFYQSTKLCSELLVNNYSAFFDVDILRFFFVYGEKQRRDMLIPRLVDSVRDGKKIILQGDEGIKINPVYVEDAVNAIMEIIKKEGSFIVNIGGAEIITIKSLCELVGNQLGKAPVFEFQKGDVKSLIGDISKMKALYQPVITLSNGIARMAIGK